MNIEGLALEVMGLESVEQILCRLSRRRWGLKVRVEQDFKMRGLYCTKNPKKCEH
jgi:hypothetical protein